MNIKLKFSDFEKLKKDYQSKNSTEQLIGYLDCMKDILKLQLEKKEHEI